MTYFELFELPLRFEIDPVLLKKKFYELSKRYHPDFYINESEQKQYEILGLSTQVNKAYQILSDPQKRVEYILTQLGLLSEESKHQLPQDFLMEMMEINEAVMDLSSDANLTTQGVILARISELAKSLFEELKQAQQAFDSASGDDKKNILLKIKDIWYRQKYLLRIQDSLNKFAAR